MKKVIVAQGLAKLSIPQKIESTRFKITSVTGNVNFPTPTPTMAILTANVNALETAFIAAKGGGMDETAAMHAREDILDLSLKLLAAYVENIANSNPVNAEAIVLSAGMDLKKQGPARANGFRVDWGINPGEIELRTNFDPRAAFIWQLTTSTETEGNWENIASGTQAHYTVTSLTPGTRYYFRVAKVNKDGQGPWSNVLNIIAV